MRDKLPNLYRIIHLLTGEISACAQKSGKRVSLKGIWKGSYIDESLFTEVRKSLFPYEKGRITLSFEETLTRIEESENFEAAPLNIEVLKIADKIDADLEMHDRLIVTTALHYDAALITKDKNIVFSGILSTIWQGSHCNENLLATTDAFR